MFDFDMFVIGGGSGGVRAARIAAGQGHARVGLAEEFRMGGTCVIRGCVPKKLMVLAADFAPQMADARAYGWDVTSGGFDWLRFRGQLEVELRRLEGAYRATLTNAGVQIFDTRATIADPHTVALADGRRLTARHIVVATGGRPFVPDIPGAGLGITSNDIFGIDALPARALIFGGGYIACEFASILNGLGVQVTLVCRAAEVLRGFDEECRHHIAAGMRARGIDILPGREVARLDGRAQAVRATLTDGSLHDAGLVLFATGRVPNTQDLGLEEIGIALAARGQVPVDGYSQTVVPSVFAVGDVTDRIALTPVAIREGHALAQTLFLGRPTQADHELVASAIFARPEYGTIGLTEQAARARGAVDVYAATFRPMQTLFAGREDRALFKLVVDRASDRVLGCHIVAPGAAEMIQMVAVAVKMGATKADFDRAVAVHPTMAEELVTIRLPRPDASGA
jgi:glutathione reductase (NADPH)